MPARLPAGARFGQDRAMAVTAPRAVVCVPTYNERENLEPLVRALAGTLDVGSDRVLVLDDGSPDGTGALADTLAAELPWLSVLHRPAKQGIGAAYLAGFPLALATGARFVLEMDCDFSHDPRDVPRLIAACEGGADLALGSRWVAGGGTVNWGLGRRLISRAGSLYARTLLGVGVRDLTGGFKCFRRGVLETLDLGAVTTRGYGFQIEVTYRALRAGFAVAEVPITFVDRRVGQSKMSGAIVLEAMRQVPVLRARALAGRL
jgi:dolichol-phosphate mannosyltransferase